MGRLRQIAGAFALLACGVAAAQGQGPHIFAAIHTESDPSADLLCAAAREAISAVSAVPSNGCARVSSLDWSFSRTAPGVAYPMALTLGENPDGSLLVLLDAWSPAALEGVPRLQWKVTAGSPGELQALLHTALSDAVPVEPAPLAPDYGATALELGVMLGAGTLWYVADTAVNGPDWEYDLSWRDVRRKLFTLEPYQFDDNDLHLNSPGHVFAGALYYLSARNHRLPPLGALAASSAAAAVWEYVPEYREIVSLNDLILTPAGGLTLGESLFQLSAFFQRSADTRVNRLLAALFAGPSGWCSRRLRLDPSPRRLDRAGLDASGWHRLRLTYGVVAHSSGRLLDWTAGNTVGFDSELILREGFGRPGREHGWTTDPVASRLSASGGIGAEGLLEGHLLSEVTWAAYVAREVHGGPDRQRPSGLEGFAGLSALYEHREQRLGAQWDRVAEAGPIGFSGRVHAYAGALRLEAAASAHPVFAAVQSLASRAPTHDEAPDVLARHGYFWAFGARGAARVQAAYGPVTLGGAVGVEAFGGVEAQALRDSRTRLTAFGEYALEEGLRARLSLQHTERTSEAWVDRVSSPDARLEAQLGWEF